MAEFKIVRYPFCGNHGIVDDTRAHRGRTLSKTHKNLPSFLKSCQKNVCAQLRFQLDTPVPVR